MIVNSNFGRRSLDFGLDSYQLIQWKYTQNTTVCFTDGSVVSPEKHGLGKCGSGVVQYKDGLHEAP